MMEVSEEELRNFFKAWVTTFVCLTYCYTIPNFTSKAFPRFIAILPIILIFLALPLTLTSFHLCGLTAFFIAWLANFKLLLFAFHKGPLISSHSFPRFLALASLPIKLQQNAEKSPQNTWNLVIKSAILVLIIGVYPYTEHIHPKILWVIYFFHIYFALEIILGLLAKSVMFLLNCELEPTFNEPLLFTSLQDFWGKRWNIMVTRILRPTVYLPVLDFSRSIVGRERAALPAVMATFVVSALMHELIFYYLGHLRPTFEVTCFFLLHGFSLCLEILIKKAVAGKWSVPVWVSGPATLGFVVVTAFWLFLPPLLRAGLATKGVEEEYAAFGRFVKRYWSEYYTILGVTRENHGSGS